MDRRHRKTRCACTYDRWNWTVDRRTIGRCMDRRVDRCALGHVMEIAAEPRGRPRPPRVLGARRGRVGPEVGPASQRLSQSTLPCLLGVRFRTLRIFVTGGSKRPGNTGLRAAIRTAARARAPGWQMIWTAPGSSLAFQRRSRATFPAGSAFRLAEFRSQLENSTDFVTYSQGVPDDVRGLGGVT
eukprot:gene25202-biopygen17984